MTHVRHQQRARDCHHVMNPYHQVLGEHHKDRAEERAARSDAKIAMLEAELGGVNKSMKSLSVAGIRMFAVVLL